MAFLQGEVPWLTVALSASVAKTVAGLKAPANQCVKILEVSCSHDGATSSNAPDITEFARCTFSTNSPGTNSTSVTIGKKDPGRDETVQTTAGHTWTVEPQAITNFRAINLAQYNGLMSAPLAA